MRDKDIKELFDSAADNFTYSDITPEEIKNLVDGRINRNTEEFSDNYGETVEPVFVTVDSSKRTASPKVSAVIGALSAAAVIAIGLNFQISTGRPASLSENNSADAQTALSIAEGADTAQGDKLIQTLTAPETTDKEALSKKMFTLLNGVQGVYKSDGVKFFKFNVDTNKYANFIYSTDDRLVYSGREEETDVTDYIGSDKCYSDYFYDKSNRLAQYVLIGGDVGTENFGYAIIFKSDKEDRWGILAVMPRKFTLTESSYVRFDYLTLNAAWLAEGIEQIEEQYGENIEISVDYCFMVSEDALFW